MSELEKISAVLKKEKPKLKKNFKVAEIGIFGSFSRGDQSDKSYIDLLVEFSEPVGFEFFELKERLETIFGRKIDLVTKNALRPQLKEKILEDLKLI